MKQVYTDRRASFCIVFLVCVLAMLLSTSLCMAENIEMTVYAQGYTPEVVNGEGFEPLHQFTYIAHKWEKLHPGVTIKFIKNPTGDYRTWMLAQLKGNLAPDIIWAHASWANDDAKYGWFQCLDKYLAGPNKYIPGNKVWYNTLYTSQTDALRAPNGSLYVLPVDLVETGIYYNKDIFNKLGLKPPKTWVQLLDVCKKIKAAGYVPVLFNGDQMRFDWIRTCLEDQLFGDLIPKMDVRKRLFNSFPVDTQEFVRAYKKGIWTIRDPRYAEQMMLIKEWSKYWNKDWTTSSGRRAFVIGRAAMFWDGSWATPTLLRDKLRKFEFGVFPVPRLTKETSKYAGDIPAHSLGGAFGIQYGITSSAIRTKKVDLAVDFLQFVTAPENLGPLVSEAKICLPNSPSVPSNPVLAPFKESLKSGTFKFGGENCTRQYGEESYRVYQSYLGGEYTLKQAIDHLDRFLKPAVDQLIGENPQWNFDKNWEILPDKSASEIKKINSSPAFVKFIPFTLIGIVLLVWLWYVIAHRKRLWHQIVAKKFIYPFVIPTIVLLLAFNYYPVFSAFYHSLFNWEGGGNAIWVGFANFRELAGDAIFRESAVNAFKLLVFGIIVSITVPLAAAELLFHLKSERAQYIYRVLFVIPMVVPGIVVMLIWGFFYDYDLGAINQALRAMHLGQYAQVWLGNPKVALYSLMFMGFPWVGGFSLLIYYAGLQSIPKDVLDSCLIDGASGLRRIWAVDIPLVMAQMKLLIVLGFIGGIQGFQTQLLLTRGGPGYSTMVPGLHLYNNAVSYDRMGYACAMGVVLFLVILALTYINMKYVKSSTEHEAK